MTNDLLISLLETLKTDVIHSLQAHGKIATGQTVSQITIVGNGKKAQLQLPGYLQLLESGRRPTGSNPLAANPPMIERIKEWCAAKGIPEQAAWAIKKAIDKKGYKGVPGILSEPLGDENINLRLNPIAQDIANKIATTIAD